MIVENDLSSLFVNFTEESKDFSANNFCRQIHSTIELYISQNPNLGKQQCTEYAQTLFRNAINKVNINSLLTSLVIFEYLNEKLPFLQIDSVSQPIITKIEQMFDCFQFSISVPDWAPYSNKECIEKIGIAAQNKNSVSIIRELQPFYNGTEFEDCRAHVVHVIIKWLWAVDKKKIIDGEKPKRKR